MPAIQKILFPVDFSERCVGAARYVEAIAGRFQAEILLLHAVDHSTRTLAKQLLPSRQRMMDSFLLSEFKYFTTQRICVIGEPAPTITKMARTWRPDVVVMPTHGLRLYDRLVLGSVTERMLNELDCPLWTDVHSATAPPLEKIGCRKILCAVDLSDQSRRVLEWASFLAAEYQAKLEIVHAVAEVAAAAASDAHYLGATPCIADKANQIHALQTSVGTSGAVTVESGDVAEIVVSKAKNADADLLVVGRHGGTGFYGQFHQHLYSIVCQSPCPALII